jgi:hypothetical protein
MTADAAVNELLDADRAYASAAGSMNVVDGIGQLLAPDVWVPTGGRMVMGRDSAIAAMRTYPDNLESRLHWSPIRVGISADGQHGFTYGFMTLVRPDSSTIDMKYLAYWVKGADGWKAVAFKRGPRPAGDVPTAMRPPSLPASMVEVNYNEADVAGLAEELAEAERAFSSLAGEIGLGQAFIRNAAPDAMNLGGQDNADFIYGPEAIGAGVGSGEEGPSKLTWGPDHVIVASSGDLGVSIGHINIPGADGGPGIRVPFFTIWRRDGPQAPWRFVAE